ncbi:MAG: PilZ domain-containing protein [Gammaproteobacteria bacterium]|nr:PilZ domain-containing protein [Gammaproteobacteria bacterium]
MTIQKHSPERRRFFRIDDLVFLQFQVGEQEGEEQPPSSASESNVYPYINEFRRISAESKHYLHSAENIDPHLTAFLQAMNRKIDCLAQAILFTQEEHPRDANCAIQLSEGGFSTLRNQAYSPGEIVKCKIILYPDNHVLRFCSKVIYCYEVLPLTDDRIKNDSPAASSNARTFQVGLEFMELNEGDSQLLARHIINKQANARRQGHFGSEPTG